MNQYERMIKGLIYDPCDCTVCDQQAIYQKKVWDFNQLKPEQKEEKEQYMKEVFAQCGENCYIELPFYANWGGAHLHLKNNVYVNFALTLVDDADIYIGNNTMIAPNVTITTANHPIDSELRKKGYQYNKEVHIGNNVWIGSNVVILPGVHIGDNTVIGAGSIVTKDIPSNVVAFGNPCRVIREIGSYDKEYFYKNERIDWENL